MMCSLCNSPKVKTEVINHKFVESGLDNISLGGVKRTHCNNCGEVIYNFGNLIALNRAIADLLIKKRGVLSGKEIRFLRSHLGYSGKDFAKLIEYNPQAWSKIENEKVRVDKRLDKYIRFVAANAMPDHNYDLHDLLSNEELLIDFKRAYFKCDKNKWKFDLDRSA